MQSKKHCDPPGKVTRVFLKTLGLTVDDEEQGSLDEVPIENENHLGQFERQPPNIREFAFERQHMIPQQKDESYHCDQIISKKNGRAVERIECGHAKYLVATREGAALSSCSRGDNVGGGSISIGSQRSVKYALT